MNSKYFIAKSTQMDKRKALAQEFYNSILEPEEIPFIVTDEACLYDIYIGTEVDLIKKVNEKYGIKIDIKHFKIPFWKLLDYIEENKGNKR